MRSLPPEPSSGDKVTADFARELIRAIKERQLLDGPDYALARGPNGTVLKLKQSNQKQHPARVRPWEIHFFPAQTQEDEDFWGVYLPAGSLNVAGEEVTPTDETGAALAAAGTAYPGYYVIPVSGETVPAAVWLHVYSAGDDDAVTYSGTVSLSPEADPQEDDEVVTSIRICTISQAKAITQVVVGAIALTPCQDKDEDEDEDPDHPDNPPEPDPCDHDEPSGNNGGVAADYDITVPGGGDYYGGVSAEGGVHTGDNDCNCP